jgi:hypothetical protein
VIYGYLEFDLHDGLFDERFMTVRMAIGYPTTTRHTIHVFMHFSRT